MSNKIMSDENYKKLKQQAEEILETNLGKRRSVEGVLNNNWVFLTNDGDKPYMVKFIPEDEKVRLEVEVALYQFIQQRTDLPVPKIVKYEEQTEGAYLLREVIVGQTAKEELKEVATPERLFAQAGECLARLHSFEFATKGVFDSQMAVQAYDIYSSGEYQLILKPLYEKGLLSEIEYQNLQQIDVDSYFDNPPYVLCHCDYSFNNLIARDGEIVGIIDLEWAAAAPFMDDVAAFDLFAHIDGWETYLSHFYEGYQRFRPIPAFFFTDLKFYKFYRMITMLSYQVNIPEERFEGDFNKTLRNMLREFLDEEMGFRRVSKTI